MAYSKTTFQRQGGAGPQQHYSYVTPDAIATVIAADYFNEATSQISQNDFITVVSSTGGTRAIDLLVVTSATGAASVTTTNGT